MSDKVEEKIKPVNYIRIELDNGDVMMETEDTLLNIIWENGTKETLSFSEIFTWCLEDDSVFDRFIVPLDNNETVERVDTRIVDIEITQ